MTVLLTITDDQHAELYTARGGHNRGTIFYIHGGGFIYGDKNDLPAAYIDQFTAAGYNVLSIDYPLAPEVSLPTIIQSVQTAYDWFCANCLRLTGTSRIILFGRSAGAYLAYQLLTAQDLPIQPKAFINFYGFFDIFSPKLVQPDAYYQQFASVALPAPQEKPQYTGSLTERFPVYLTVRQKGQWQGYIDATPAMQRPVQFGALPPMYICHALHDPDVPFGIAIQEKARHPRATLVSINADQHDFDRVPTVANHQIYAGVIGWLEGILDAE
jgi:acetyl esterase/lipase